MGKQDSDRVQHDVGIQPNPYRNTDLEQILNDLGEEDTGKGFSEVTRSGGVITQITVWDSPSKNKKRSETTINRTGAFVSSLTRVVFNEDGTSTVATITGSVARTGQNLVQDVDVGVSRP